VSTPEPPDADEPPLAATVEEPAAPAPAEAEAKPSPPEEEDRPSTWQPWLYLRIALLLIVIAWAIAFVAKNTRQIKIDFVFTDASVRVIWTILLLLAIGLVSGVLLSQLYRHRRRTQLAKKGRKPRDAGGDVGGRDEAEGKAS
jgi:uncharacterized membrane protein YciS (DUF1049 family)